MGAGWQAPELAGALHFLHKGMAGEALVRIAESF